MAFARRKSILFVALAGILIAGGIAGWVYLNPLEYKRFKNAWELKRLGVESIKTQNGLHALVQDQCGKTVRGAECRCLTFVHGLGLNATSWRKMYKGPKEGWGMPTYIASFDLPGAGRSPAPQNPADYRVREQARTLQKSLAELCPKWAVIGMSMGGWVAAWVALDWPEGVDRLLLAGSAGLKKYQDEQVSSAFVDPTVEKLKDFDNRAYFHKRKIPDRVWNDVLKQMKGGGVVSQILQAQTDADFLDKSLRSLRMPTLIFWGKEDRVIPPTYGKLMQSMIPASIYKEVPQCGHIPQSDCPDAFFKSIKELLNYGFM